MKSFLDSEEAQEKARNGVIWIDEAGLLGIRQVSDVFEAADRLNAPLEHWLYVKLGISIARQGSPVLPSPSNPDIPADGERQQNRPRITLN